MKKKSVVYILTVEYYSAIRENEILSSAATCVGLESVMLSKVSQRKTNTA